MTDDVTEAASATVAVPRVTPPLPDELLGSWLSRIAREVQSSVWRSLTSSAGIAAQRWARTDVGSPSARTDTILSALGTDYASALMELTTYPFWSFFDADLIHSGGALATEPFRVPFVVRSIGRSDQRPTTTFRPLPNETRRGRSSASMRFCPQCIEDDTRMLRPPYWRRSHQITTSLVCSVHACLLVTHCPACGRLPVLIKFNQLLARPPSVCTCGASLTKAKPTADPPDGRRRKLFCYLATLNRRVLESGPPSWDYSHVRHLASQLMQRHCGDSKPATARALLMECFGFEQSAQRLWLRTGPEAVNGIRIEITPDPLRTNASGMACIFAALGQSSASLQEQLSNLATEFPVLPVSAGLPSKTTSAAPLRTVANAKERLLRTWQQGISLVNREPVNMAFVQLEDPHWLAELTGKPVRVFQATLNEDREFILGLVANGTGRKGNERNGNGQTNARILIRGVRTSQAGRRARIRDAAWLDGQCAVISPPNYSPIVNDEVVERVKSTIEALKLRTGRDAVYIRGTDLAAECGISIRRIQRLLNIRPDIKEILAVFNASAKKRRLLWYLKGFEQAGKTITPAQLLSLAGLKRPDFGILDELLLEQPELTALIRPRGTFPGRA